MWVQKIDTVSVPYLASRDFSSRFPQLGLELITFLKRSSEASSFIARFPNELFKFYYFQRLTALLRKVVIKLFIIY